MRDHHHRAIRGAQRVDAIGRDAERVDVEPGIHLVEDAQARLEQRHLKNLVALLLAAREANIDAAAQHVLPDPFGPMIACTSPLFTASDSPCRISRSSTRTCRFLTSSNAVILFSTILTWDGLFSPMPHPFSTRRRSERASSTQQ